MQEGHTHLLRGGTQDGNSKSAGNMNIYLIYIVYIK